MVVAMQGSDDDSSNRVEAPRDRRPRRRTPLGRRKAKEQHPVDRAEVGHDFETLETTVRGHVMDALTLTHGNQGQAAALLGVKLSRIVKRFELRDFVTTLRSTGEHPTVHP